MPRSLQGASETGRKRDGSQERRGRGARETSEGASEGGSKLRQMRHCYRRELGQKRGTCERDEEDEEGEEGLWLFVVESLKKRSSQVRTT